MEFSPNSWLWHSIWAQPALREPLSGFLGKSTIEDRFVPRDDDYPCSGQALSAEKTAHSWADHGILRQAPSVDVEIPWHFQMTSQVLTAHAHEPFQLMLCVDLPYSNSA